MNKFENIYQKRENGQRETYRLQQNLWEEGLNSLECSVRKGQARLVVNAGKEIGKMIKTSVFPVAPSAR